MEKLCVVKALDGASKAAAFTVRKKVFVEEQAIPAEAEFDQFDAHGNCHHFVAFNSTSNGVGAVRWRTTEKGHKLERLAVDAAERCKGVGSLLVDAVEKDIQSIKGPGQLLYLHAQVHSVPFYEKLGFSLLGDMFQECGVDHFFMQKQV